ncbi:choice-of-anchor P family protein [Nocardioides immobilis]|uniref:choice-of-anchor P family protein n=1 Tax=Nocardioides immobilis TaxID=2049295 RepID=UPI0015FB0B83|nr:choice-of-anchor P family protein [Nocardioides immobilis]
MSGGSRVTVAGVVRSELTGSSTLRATGPGRSSGNAIAAVNLLGGVLTATGVSTQQKTTRPFGGGTMITSEAKIAGVSLLGGAITVDAIETRTTATLHDDEVKRTGGTKFVNLKVRDNDLPITVPKNTTVTIPGLAKVVLNEVKGQVGGDALIKSWATGIKITLLSSFGQLEKGAVIEITPTKALIVLPVPIDGEPIFGVSYSTRTRIHVGDAVKLNAGPTSAMIMPAGGTNGAELVNSVAKINLPGLLRAFALSGSAEGTVTADESDGTMTGEVADVSLLNGAIQVDAISATAHLNQVDGSPPTVTGGSRLVGLVINGRSFPVSVEPNTVVEIPGLVKVIINEQIRQEFPFNGIAVRGLHVIALPDAPEDIVGLDLEVGVAAIWVNN